jgi:hypothetical protein
MPGKSPDQIKKIRTETLHAVWFKIIEEFEPLALVPRLNDIIVAKVVNDYVATREAFVARYKITGRIQRHKVAGLMAASILKFRPVEMNDRDHSPVYENTQGNELLAFWHGLGICAEGASEAQIEKLISAPNFKTWQGDLLCLFEQHPTSAEAFALIFETVSLVTFPDNLDRKSEEL